MIYEWSEIGRYIKCYLQEYYTKHNEIVFYNVFFQYMRNRIGLIWPVRQAVIYDPLESYISQLCDLKVCIKLSQKLWIPSGPNDEVNFHDIEFLISPRWNFYLGYVEQNNYCSLWLKQKHLHKHN